MTGKELLKILLQEKYDKKNLDVVFLTRDNVKWPVDGIALDEADHQIVLSSPEVKPSEDVKE